MREKLAAAAAEASRLQRLRTEQNAHQQAAMLQARREGGLVGHDDASAALLTTAWCCFVITHRCTMTDFVSAASGAEPLC